MDIHGHGNSVPFIWKCNVLFMCYSARLLHCFNHSLSIIYYICTYLSFATSITIILCYCDLHYVFTQQLSIMYNVVYTIATYVQRM